MKGGEEMSTETITMKAHAGWMMVAIVSALTLGIGIGFYLWEQSVLPAIGYPTDSEMAQVETIEPGPTLKPLAGYHLELMTVNWTEGSIECLAVDQRLPGVSANILPLDRKLEGLAHPLKVEIESRLLE